ncbi:hypothetical protein [Brevundimonas sp.]|uniref:hypothetical protein n=1 Tax=Brevundimonas sp. TaxID=1871086 RepID=UPI001D625FF9|nr:hypothetical protein [Brevundimonas sp.]MBL0948405.1 hypothetical protein [Brevundimonas sp.]
MRATTLPLLVAVLALGACASMEAAPATLTATETPGAPRPIADHDWSFLVEDDQASLAYGRNESDDVWLSLACDRGTRRLDLFRPADADRQAVIYLESGGETERFTGRIEPSELFEYGEVFAEAATSAPVFQRFRRLGWLGLHDAEGRALMVAHPASTDGIERFFAFCG